MILLHHSLFSWENTNNWIEPKSFDTLFTVILTLYLILTFIPDFVKYFKLSSSIRASKVQKHAFSIFEYLINDDEEETEKKKHVILKVSSTLLSNVEIKFLAIDEKLHELWKKYITLHIIIIISCFLYLSFSAFYNDEYLVFRALFYSLVIFMLLVFIIALLHALYSIKSEVNVIERNIYKVSNVMRSFHNGGIKIAFDYISKNQKEYFNKEN